jgi:energy-coupling factor transporter transmembrane protein EcfT
MRQKWLLFLGLLILTVGVVLRSTTDLYAWSLFLIVSGVVLKVFYLIKKSRGSAYRPGFEIVILIAGLLLFFTGLYFKKNGADFNPYWLMGPGIGLKIAFVMIFIRKQAQKGV